eukprot:scaffold84440_cov21-Tisochrysis_lutea.AAC.1
MSADRGMLAPIHGSVELLLKYTYPHTRSHTEHSSHHDQAAMQAKAARARADDTRDGLSESRGIATAAVAAAAQPQRRLTTPQGEAEGSKCTSEIPGLAASD